MPAMTDDRHLTHDDLVPYLVEESAELIDADLVVYLVDHDDHDTDAIVASGVPVLDCRHAIDGPNVQHL